MSGPCRLGPDSNTGGAASSDVSLENRLSLVQQMLDRAAAELTTVLSQLKGENPGGSHDPAQ